MKTLHATEPHFIRCVVPNAHSSLVVLSLLSSCISSPAMVCLKESGFAERDSQTECLILTLNLVTTFLLLVLWQRQRMIRPQRLLFLIRLVLKRKNSDLVILRFSSGLEF